MFFDGKSMWLIDAIRPILESLPHLISDSRAVKNDLVNNEATRWQGFTTLDIKDFDLNGKPEILANAAGTLLEGKIQDLVVNAIWYILNNQYVASPHLRPAIFKITRGSGIGVRHSGDLADIALHSLVEKPLLEQHVMQESGILK